MRHRDGRRLEPRPAPPSAVIRARGHANISARHHKTIELTRDEAITPRATCVVGVAAEEFPPELHLLRGQVRITISAGDASISGHAVINPVHEVSRRLVIRRSTRSDVDTLANRADFAADALDRLLRAELGRPGLPVTMAVEEIRPRQPLLLLGDPTGAALPGRAGRLWRHADATVSFADDRASRPSAQADAALRTLADGGTVAATLPSSLERSSAEVTRWLVAAGRLGARLAAPAADVAAVALLAAGVPPTPTVRLGRVDRRMARRTAIAGQLRLGSLPVVITLAPDDVAHLLGPIAEGDDARPVAVPDRSVDVGTRMNWTTLAEAVPDLSTYDTSEVTIVLAARERSAVTAEVRDVARALLAAGVSARNVSEALKPWGISRDEIYAMRSSSEM